MLVCTAPPLRVLVVDDNRDIREGLALLLRAWGHETRLARDGRAALRACDDWTPDAAILDIDLAGDMDGCEAARRLRTHPALADCLLVALTGRSGPRERERCRGAGFDFYVGKPADPVVLRRLLASAPACVA